MGKS
jgi:hypothetical protein